jgi:hypothetical protein
MKAGEKLRVETLYYTLTTGSGVYYWLWFDGANRGATLKLQVTPDTPYQASLGYYNSTNLIVTVPFRLDL